MDLDPKKHAITDAVGEITNLMVKEVSLVKNPAVPTAKWLIVKEVEPEESPSEDDDEPDPSEVLFGKEEIEKEPVEQNIPLPVSPTAPDDKAMIQECMKELVAKAAGLKNDVKVPLNKVATYLGVEPAPMGKEEDEVDDDKKEPSLDDVLSALQKLVPVLTALQPKAEKPTPAAKPAAAKPATPAKKEMHSKIDVDLAVAHLQAAMKIHSKHLANPDDVPSAESATSEMKHIEAALDSLGAKSGMTHAKKELDEEEILESFVKELDGTEIEKDYFSTELRRQLVASGEAMPNGSYAVRDKNDLSCAIKAFPRAKDSDAARDHIMSRAKALNAEEMIPKEWSATPVEESVLEETHKEISEPEQDMLTRVAHLLQKQNEQRTLDKYMTLLNKVDTQIEKTKSKTIQTQRSLLKAMGRDPGDLEE